MFELLYIAIALIGTLACGLWDLKTTNVPDVVGITMITTGLGLHALESYLIGSWNPLYYSLMFAGVFLLFGLIMYFSGQWGGGDGELLVGIGALLPTSIISTMFPFSVSYFINLLFVGSIYSIIYSFFLIRNNKKILKQFIKSFDKKTITAIIILIAATIVIYLTSNIMLSIISMLMVLLLVLQKYAKAVDDGFYKKIPVSKLNIDDMIGENIPKLKIFKNRIRGLTKAEVKKIKKSKKYVIIRDGIRWSMAFFLTLLFTIYFGDFMLLFI